MELRKYGDLPVLDGLGLPHAWGEFGEGDRLGTINLLTAERVRAAMCGVAHGRVFNLSLPLNLPDPPLFGRKPMAHTVTETNRNTMDDSVDSLFLQASSQWDSLRHVRAREFGFYGGRQEGEELGVGQYVDHGIVGRGVLLDVAAYLESTTGNYHPFSDRAIDAQCLRATADHQGVKFEVGDILLLRTGWVSAYLAANLQRRTELAGERRWAGLRPDADMAEFLWDQHFAAVAADNPALENAPGDPAIGSLHRRLLPMLGMAVGELWQLDMLAEYARTESNWYSCVVSIPLNVPTAVGSPANAIAVV